MLFIVHRKFSDGNREYEPKQVVDLEGKNVEKLQSLRYISPAPESASAAKNTLNPSKAPKAKVE